MYRKYSLFWQENTTYWPREWTERLRVRGRHHAWLDFTPDMIRLTSKAQGPTLQPENNHEYREEKN